MQKTKITLMQAADNGTVQRIKIDGHEVVVASASPILQGGKWNVMVQFADVEIIPELIPAAAAPEPDPQAMASKEVVDAVLNRFAPVVDGARGWNGTAVFGPNERNGTPGDESMFIDVEFPFSATEQITMGPPGQRLYREDGTFQVVIAAARGAGTDQGLTIAGQVRDLFIGKQFSGINTYAPDAPQQDNNNENGGYYLLIVAVPYDFDFLA